MIIIHQGVSDEYREYIEKKLGDAAPQYIAMLEELLSFGSMHVSEEETNKVLDKIETVIANIQQYVAQFGFVFFVFLVKDEQEKYLLRTGLLDLISGQTAQ